MLPYHFVLTNRCDGRYSYMHLHASHLLDSSSACSLVSSTATKSLLILDEVLAVLSEQLECIESGCLEALALSLKSNQCRCSAHSSSCIMQIRLFITPAHVSDCTDRQSCSVFLAVIDRTSTSNIKRCYDVSSLIQELLESVTGACRSDLIASSSARIKDPKQQLCQWGQLKAYCAPGYGRCIEVAWTRDHASLAFATDGQTLHLGRVSLLHVSLLALAPDISMHHILKVRCCVYIQVRCSPLMRCRSCSSDAKRALTASSICSLQCGMQTSHGLFGNQEGI